MSKIQETKGRGDDNSGYVRLFGNPPLGHLISRVHATVIRTGNELEKLLEQATPASLKTELADALVQTGNPKASGTRVVFSPKIKKSAERRGITGDIVAFDYDRKVLSVIEVKDGDTFDTKKASGELDSLQATARDLANQTGFSPHIYFCSFNQGDKDAIVLGAKSRFSTEQVMTGVELCAILGIDFDGFVSARKREQAANLEYFLRELVEVKEVAARLRQLMR